MSNIIRRSLTAYSPSPDDPAIVLRLDRTEPPVPYRVSISEKVFVAWSQYPNVKPLEITLAKRWDVRAENILITAGADEALDRACRASLMAGDELLTTSPTFEMIAKYGELSGATIKEVPWLEKEFPIDDFVNQLSSNTRLIILVTPNNPTGKCIPLESIEQIAIQASDIPIVLDLAYIEFAALDPTRRLLRFPNIVVVRSFSKAWGLPGLRLGYAIGNSEIIQVMRAAGGPYSVSAQSIEILNTDLTSFESEMDDYVDTIREERRILEAWLGENEIRFLPSQANFILLFPEYPMTFDQALYTRGMRTRSLNSLPKARRLTLPGDADTFTLLMQSLIYTAHAIARRSISNPIH